MSNSTDAAPAFPSSDLGAWTRRLRREPALELQPAALQAVAAIDAEALDGAVGFAAEHVRRYIASGGRDDGWEGPRPILVLYAPGRSSGRFRRLPLLYVEHEGRRYIVGSKGGAPRHPDWFMNVVAEPRVFVRVFEELFEARARVLDDAEHDALWPLVTARYPMFGEYQQATPRRIPVVELVPAPAADVTVAGQPAIGEGRPT
jgi:deazaflavin-dependent oxidoreductase (nitroreductase family)